MEKLPFQYMKDLFGFAQIKGNGTKLSKHQASKKNHVHVPGKTFKSHGISTKANARKVEADYKKNFKFFA